MTNPAVTSNSECDRQIIEGYLQRLLPAARGEGTALEAMRYAVMSPGQRIRPLIALRVARLLGAESSLSLRAAAAVELVHCASLIIDDLPCMDDEVIRRGRPTVHRVYGEATAILAAFALVALAARSVMEAGPCERALEFQIQLLKVLDVGALIAGQSLDLALKGDLHDAAMRSRLTELKTVPLFVLAVRAGMVSAQVEPFEEALLLRFGRDFGLAFQAADDLADGEEIETDSLNTQLMRARASLSPFASGAHELEEIIDYLNAKVSPENSSHR